MKGEKKKKNLKSFQGISSVPLWGASPHKITIPTAVPLYARTAVITGSGRRLWLVHCGGLGWPPCPLAPRAGRVRPGRVLPALAWWPCSGCV